MGERQKLFDAWAGAYDASLENATGFPFEGYAEVLAGVVGGAGVGAGARVLDVGTGTGALAARFAALGCEVVGVDFSAEMLRQAQQRAPGPDFRQLDLLGAWGDLEAERFDAIVSAYVLHEFDVGAKLELLNRLAALLKSNGRLVIGDISFGSEKALVAAHEAYREVWDEDEFYWNAAEAVPALAQGGFSATYRQVSFCGGVYALQPTKKAPGGASVER